MSKVKEFEIYFNDLTEKAQKELLQMAEIETPQDANWDGYWPIASVIIGEDN